MDVLKTQMGLLKDEKGVTAIEYALIAAFIAIVIIFGVTQAGEWIHGAFVYIADSLQTAGVPAPSPAGS